VKIDEAIQKFGRPGLFYVKSSSKNFDVGFIDKAAWRAVMLFWLTGKTSPQAFILIVASIDTQRQSLR
jgi:hypothetical protein